MMTPRQRLYDALDAAAALRDAGDFAGARSSLLALAADPDAQVLGEITSLGLPRRLHAALLKVAKAEPDLLLKTGYQFHLVPDPSRLARFAKVTMAERRAITAANRQPVPRAIHQIWIGSLALPVGTSAWAGHAKAHGYAYKLWREADLRAIGLNDNPVFRAMVDAGDYPGAVDVARYALLVREGGLYLDCDWYPARPDIGFHDLLPMTGLCAMAENVPRNTGKGPLLLANSLIASPPGHPVLRKINAVLHEVLNEMPRAPAWWATGPLLFTLIARGGSVTLADDGLVAGTLRRGAPLAEVLALCDAARSEDGGLLVAWKSW